MKPSTLEWVKKAEADYLAALTLSRKKKVPLHDAVCFHCQQSAEKYLKARIEEQGIRVPKTHDLDALLSLLLSVEPLWAALRVPLLRLSDYAVHFRYPGHEATLQDVKMAKQDAKVVRKEVRLSLRLRV
jgi:HEPN domain-containing protein